MNGTQYASVDLTRFQRMALLVGAAALVVCALGAASSPAQFFQSYLFAFLFWAGIALGCFALVMLHNLVGGGWGVAVRRLIESGTKTLPLVALLILPLLAGMRHLYIWARPEAVAADELLQHKSPYLNVPFFVGRTVFYFAVWIVIAWLLNKWTSNGVAEGRARALSGPGILLFGLTVTFASIDWVMSLEPHWFSTIYGIVFMVGQVLATLAFLIAALMLLARSRPVGDPLRPQSLHDLGNLMLAFVMLWAYVAFSQYLIIWSGNLPEELPWYVKRLRGGWGWFAGALIGFHFILPFLLLLSRQNKRRLGALAAIAGGMIVMRLVDLYWIVTPAFHGRQLHFHWMDLAAPIGVGGIWLAGFAWNLKKQPLPAAAGGAH